MTNYYKILELQDFATIEEVKTAHRKLSKRYHPDLNNGNKHFEEKFKEIQHAYEQLRDPVTKEAHDNYLRYQYREYNDPADSSYDYTYKPQPSYTPPSDSEGVKRWWEKKSVGVIVMILLNLLIRPAITCHEERHAPRFNNFTILQTDSISSPASPSMMDSEVRSIRLGATKREISNTVGIPDHVVKNNSDEIWTYGSSTITFRNDTLIGYSDLPEQFTIKSKEGH